jgi:hypothetical protein
MNAEILTNGPLGAQYLVAGSHNKEEGSIGKLQ